MIKKCRMRISVCSTIKKIIAVIIVVKSIVIITKKITISIWVIVEKRTILIIQIIRKSICGGKVIIWWKKVGISRIIGICAKKIIDLVIIVIVVVVVVVVIVVVVSAYLSVHITFCIDRVHTTWLIW